MTPTLSIVAAAPQKPETISQHIRRLQVEARALALGHVAEYVAAIAALEALSDEIADGGDAYPPGLRDLARRLAADLGSRGMTVKAIAGKAK